MERLDGQVAIITGGSSGLGEATTLALARAGATTVPIDIDEKAIRQLTVRLHALGVPSLPLTADISDEIAVKEAIETVATRLGRIDIVINIAAINHIFPIAETTIGQWDQAIGVNLRCAFLITKAALPIMQAQRSGHFVNVAWTAAKRAWANAAGYQASMWGLIGFTRGLAVEGCPYNIKATVIVPGGMRTRFFDCLEVPPDPRNLQDPESVAGSIVFAAIKPSDCAIQETIVTPLTET